MDSAKRQDAEASQKAARNRYPATRHHGFPKFDGLGLDADMSQEQELTALDAFMNHDETNHRDRKRDQA
jgi:hypothetical protein